MSTLIGTFACCVRGLVDTSSTNLLSGCMTLILTPQLQYVGQMQYLGNGNTQLVH